MALKIERGIIPSLMKDFKAAAKTGGQISATELKKTVNKGIKMIKDEYAGATSESGLAAARNALAKTVRAADKDWKLTSAATKSAKELLGTHLDGKGGTLKTVEAKIRNEVHTTSFGGYGGGGSVGGYGGFGA